jgi:hypothetical protein
MRKKVFLTVCFALCLTVFSSGIAQADPVSAETEKIVFPQLFYGNLTINGLPAPVGTEVKAVGDGILYTKDNPVLSVESGKYGTSGELLVQGMQPGDEITFYINGELADQTTNFKPIAENSQESSTRLDLSVTTDTQQTSGGDYIPSTQSQTGQFVMSLFGAQTSFSLDSSGRLTEDVYYTSSNGEITVYIPAGTLVKDGQGNPLAEFTILESDSAPPPPSGKNILGLAFSFLPDDTTFDPPITVYFSYEEDQIPAGVQEEDLVVAYYDTGTGTWIEYPSIVNASDNLVEATMSHCCYVAIMYAQPAGPSAADSTDEPITAADTSAAEASQGEVTTTTDTAVSSEETAALSGESARTQESGTTSYLTWYIIGGIALVVIIVAVGLAWRRARRYG